MIAHGQVYLQTDLRSQDFACDVTSRHFVKTHSINLHNASSFLIDIDKMDW